VTAAQSPPAVAAAGPAAGEHTAAAVIAAARALAAHYRTTPDLRRLRPEVRQLVEAVDALDRATPHT